MKWVYRGFKFSIYTDWIYLIPSIELHTLDYSWSPPQQVNIQIHFLIFHMRWLWRREYK